MTCFWQGIIGGCHKHKLLSKLGFTGRPSPDIFIQKLKKLAIPTFNVQWCMQKLSHKQMIENLQAINNYDISKIKQGHWCSSCDYFLLLMSELLKCDIEHVYRACPGNTPIIYVYKGKNHSGTTMKFGSNRGHFWSI